MVTHPTWNPTRKKSRPAIILAAAALVLVLFAAAPPVSATVLYDNFNTGDTFDTDAGWGVGFVDAFFFQWRYEQAMPFSYTGTGSDHYAESVTLALHYMYGDSGVLVHLCEDDAGEPGTILESKTATAPATAGPVTVAFNGNTVLTEGNTYWIWLSRPTGESLSNWMKNTTSDVGNHAISIDGGIGWTINSETLSAFRVEGTVVPPPIPPVFDFNSGEEDQTIYGGASGDQMTDEALLAVGDVNGDGVNDMIMGAPNADGPSDARSGCGEVYVFFGDRAPDPVRDVAGTVGDAPDVIIYGAASGDALSYSHAAALGDVNGDGVLDIIVGAQYADYTGSTRIDSGKTYVIYGVPGTEELPETIDLAAYEQDVTIHGATAGDRLTGGGGSIIAGDINDDGIDDIILGAPFADGSGESRTDSGEVCIIYGSASLAAEWDLASSAENVTIYGASAYDQLTIGGALLMLDIDRDAILDLVMGTMFGDAASDAKLNAGDAYVIYGSSSLAATIDLSTSADLAIYGGTAGDLLTEGGAMAAGDVDGDGVDDLILGASSAGANSGARPGSGEAYVIYGSSSLTSPIDLSSSADVTIWGVASGDAMTLSGTLATGDVNDDGLADILLGSPYRAGGGTRTNSGEAYVVFGDGSLGATIDLSSSADVTIIGASNNDLMTSGGALTVGDIDADGIQDILLGAPYGDGPTGARSDCGEAYLVLGSASMSASYDMSAGVQAATAYGASANDMLTYGGALAAADVNTDGSEDVIVGAPFAEGPSGGRSDSGEAYVINGIIHQPTAQVIYTDHSGDVLGKSYRTARVDIDFNSGDAASTTTVGLTRNDAGTGLPASRTANVRWFVTTDRTNFSADMVFHYIPDDVTDMAEDQLVIYWAATLGGGYIELPTVRDYVNRTLTVSGVTNAGSFVIYEESDEECFIRSLGNPLKGLGFK